MAHSHQSTEHQVTTQGHVIRWATFYDPLVQVMTFGQAARLRRTTVALARIQPGDHVLDVGCGTGDLTLAAARQVGSTGRVVGIDPAAEMIAAARQKITTQETMADFRVGVVESLSFADASFDVVLNSLMMHHLPHDLKAKGLTEIHRVLRPGGRLLIVDFKRPTSTLAKLFTFMQLHGGMQMGVQELAPLLQNAQFAEVAAGKTNLPMLGSLTAHKPANAGTVP